MENLFLIYIFQRNERKLDKRGGGTPVCIYNCFNISFVLILDLLKAKPWIPTRCMIMYKHKILSPCPFRTVLLIHSVGRSSTLNNLTYNCKVWHFGKYQHMPLCISLKASLNLFLDQRHEDECTIYLQSKSLLWHGLYSLKHKLSCLC